MKAEWAIDLSSIICDDEFIHHYCSNCQTPAHFYYTHRMDEGYEYIDGIEEEISRYCPECGCRMERKEALRDVKGCSACAHCHDGEKCKDCVMYVWNSDEGEDLFELKKEYI